MFKIIFQFFIIHFGVLVLAITLGTKMLKDDFLIVEEALTYTLHNALSLLELTDSFRSAVSRWNWRILDSLNGK